MMSVEDRHYNFAMLIPTSVSHTQLDGAVIGSETAGGLDFETATFGATNILDNNESHDNNLNLSVGGDASTTVTGDLANADKEQVNNATVLGGARLRSPTPRRRLSSKRAAVDGVNCDPTAVNTDAAQAQVITKDETNSAEVYVDTKAIEEIAAGLPTI